MTKYLIVLYHKTGMKQFSLISDRYPSYTQVVSSSGISENDIIDYEVHY